MQEIIGVRFKKLGKIYFFDPDGIKVQKGKNVIVETARGLELGEVAVANKEISEELFLSIHTVEDYVSDIYDKCDVKNRTELVNKFNCIKP